MIYDALASRYGYTINEFYELTLRQVTQLLKVSRKAKHKELAQDAALHCVKLKETMQPIDVSDEERGEQDKQASAALDRLRERHKRLT